MIDEHDTVRCESCGARNGPDAPWCTQCYAPLADEAAPAPEPTAEPPPEVPTAPGASREPAQAVAASPGSDGLLPLPTDSDQAHPRDLQAGEGRFRQGGDGLEWCCDGCRAWNRMERVTCEVCGEIFGPSLGPDVEPDTIEVPPAALAGASLVLPGAGHWLLGLRGPALLRALLGLVWGLGGLTLFQQARGSGQSFLPAVPLLLGWAVVAAGSANDAVVEGGGSGRLVLSGRTLLWLTLVVVGGTFAAVLVGVLSAVGN